MGIVQKALLRCRNWVIIEYPINFANEFLNFTFSDGILEQVGIVPMPSAKQQPSNIKHGGGIRSNVWVLTLAPPPTLIW